MTVGPTAPHAACCSAGYWGRGHRSTRCPTGSARTASRGVLELADDELLQSPIPEIEALRGPVHRQRDLAILPGTAGYLEHAAGDALELELTVDLRRTRARRFGAGVRLSRDGRGARVWYEPAGNRIGVDRLLGPEQVYANPAATRRGDLQGRSRNCRRRRSPRGRVPSTVNQVPSPCASSWTVPSWRCTAAAPRSLTACIPSPPPPASTSTQRAEWPTSRRLPCGRCAAPGDRGSLFKELHERCATCQQRDAEEPISA